MPPAPHLTDGPFFNAWVDAEDKVFSTDFTLWDEEILSMKIEHNEGEAATMTLEIVNPGVGLLSPGRQTWMWVSWMDPDGNIHPLFFGQLIAIPQNILGEVITIDFVARSLDFQSLKLALAQQLKVPPWYSPIWVDTGKQSDPDAVLEGYSRRYHIDRLDHTVSASDELFGEDGTVDFTAADVFYDSVDLQMDKTPQTSVSVRAEVDWNQVAIGTVDMGQRNFTTYTGDGLISEWPKPYSDLGQGWSAGASQAVDVYNIATRQPVNTSFSYKNKSKKHNDGELLSMDESFSGMRPAIGPEFFISTKTEATIGFPPMQSITEMGYGQQMVQDYPGSAPSISIQVVTMQVALWLVSTALELRYNTSRERKEVINFTLSADVQDVVQQSGFPFDAETLDVPGANVGVPLYSTATFSLSANASDGDSIAIGAVTYLFQTTLTAGVGHVHIGASDADTLTNLINAINVNGAGVPGVDYSPQNTANKDVYATSLSSTQMLVTSLVSDRTVPVSRSGSALSWSARGVFTLRGTGNVSPGHTVTVSGVTYTFDTELAIKLQMLTFTQHVFRQVPYHVLIGNDLEGSLINLANAINAAGGAGSDYTTGTLMNQSAAAYTLNGVLTVAPRYAGSVVTVAESSSVLSWDSTTDQLIPDANTIPIVDASRRSFLQTANGLEALEALICRARAQLLLAARAAKISWETLFLRVVGMSCRMNATIHDPRLPGAVATGKVTSYFLSVNGDSGEQKGGVTIGCAIGNGDTLSPALGAPTWADDDYIDPDYQQHTGALTLLPISDVGYSPPLQLPADDGLVFPLSKSSAVISERVINNFTSQEELLNEAWEFAHSGGIDTDLVSLIKREEEQRRRMAESLTKKHVVYELVLKPLTGGPFSTEYTVTCSDLMVPKQIDLGAA